MGIKISFAKVKAEMKDFGPWELKPHPCKLHVDAYMHDQEGNQMLDADGKPQMWRTNNGDAKWQIEWISLKDETRRIRDNLNFSGGGQKRVWVLYTRAGLAQGDETEADLEPEDIEGSKWWVTPKHEVRMAKGIFSGTGEKNVDQGALNKQSLHHHMTVGKIADSQYRFNAKGCGCNVCQACDGEMVNVDTRATFDGFRLMTPAEAAKFKGGVTDEAVEEIEGTDGKVAKICRQCVTGQHIHSYRHNGCECNDEVHPEF